MDYLFGYYFIVGIGVAYWISRRKGSAFCSEDSFFGKLIWAWAVAALWPIALLNYILHFREVTKDRKTAEGADDQAAAAVK